MRKTISVKHDFSKKQAKNSLLDQKKDRDKDKDKDKAKGEDKDKDKAKSETKAKNKINNQDKKKVITNVQNKVSQLTTKIYLDHLAYSHFDFEHYVERLKKEGFVLCREPSQANIIMSSFMKYLIPYRKMGGKKYLLWTHEPYHDINTESIITRDKQEIHIMNVYTKDVFMDNLRYFYFTEKLVSLDKENFKDFTDKSKTLTAFSTNYQPNYYNKNKYTTLPQRYAVIHYGVKAPGRPIKVWGRGWGKICEGDTRTDRVNNKNKTLQSYHFNLAIENTSAPYYVSEKIWESIANYCLPIYHTTPHSTIYQSFPRNSFLDYAEFKEDPQALYKYIQNMPVEEFRTRMNRCITVFNRYVDMNNDVSSDNNFKERFKACRVNKSLEQVDYKQSYKPLLDKLNKLKAI